MNRFADPPFREPGVACERCHGPGEEHIRQMRPGGGSRAAIVNPAKLDPERRDSVCAQCHLHGEARVMWDRGLNYRGYSLFVLSTDESIGFILDLGDVFGLTTSVERAISTATGQDVHSLVDNDLRANTWAYAPWNTVYTAGLSGFVACTATLNSCVDLPGTVRGIATIIPAGVLVLNQSNGTLTATDRSDPNGKQLWMTSEQLGNAISDGAGTVYAIAPQTNDVVALDGSRGVVLWRQHFASPLSAPLLGDDGCLYLCDGSAVYKGCKQ